MANKFKAFWKEVRERVRKDLEAGVLDIQDIAHKHGSSLNFVYTVARQSGIKRKGSTASDTVKSTMKEL